MQLGRIPFFHVVVGMGLTVWSGLSQQLKPAANSNAPKPPVTDSPAVVKLAVPAVGRTGFEKLAAAKHGLTPKEEYSKRPENHPIREMGNMGLAVGDVDSDGLVDLFVCGMDAHNEH